MTENKTSKLLIAGKNCFYLNGKVQQQQIFVMDTIDEAILSCLMENSKQGIKEIAEQVGLTVSPTYERIKRLENSGVITGYTVRLDKKKIGKGLSVICKVTLKEHRLENLRNFENKVVKLQEVESCYHIAGEHDYILIISVMDMEEYEHFLRKELTSISSIANVHSSFVMREIKDSTT